MWFFSIRRCLNGVRQAPGEFDRYSSRRNLSKMERRGEK
jgi:hypothetical protein